MYLFTVTSRSSDSRKSLFWQPEVAMRAYNATVLPHILQVAYFFQTQHPADLRLALRIVTADKFSHPFSKCAATPTSNGYSCAICKSAYHSQGTSRLAELFLSSDRGFGSLFDLSTVYRFKASFTP